MESCTLKGKLKAPSFLLPPGRRTFASQSEGGIPGVKATKHVRIRDEAGILDDSHQREASQLLQRLADSGVDCALVTQRSLPPDHPQRDTRRADTPPLSHPSHSLDVKSPLSPNTPAFPHRRPRLHPEPTQTISSPRWPSRRTSEGSSCSCSPKSGRWRCERCSPLLLRLAALPVRGVRWHRLSVSREMRAVLSVRRRSGKRPSDALSPVSSSFDRRRQPPTTNRVETTESACMCPRTR